MAETAKEKIEKYYALIDNYEEGAPDTRYKSWEWCHEAFLQRKDIYTGSDADEKEDTVDYLALHLAFYLASWGMYRGSSYLLQRDYKAHKPAVREILKPEYSGLWDFNPVSAEDIENANKLLFGDEGIYWKIKDSYKGFEEDPEDDDEPSDTLATKILMGTYACIPAFDRFLKIGIGRYNRNQGKKHAVIGGYKLTQSIEEAGSDRNATESFKALAAMVMEDPDTYELKSAFYYPPMKCMDMYLWQVGFEMDLAKQLTASDVSETKKKKLLNRAKNLGYCSTDAAFKDAAEQIESKNI